MSCQVNFFELCNTNLKSEKYIIEVLINDKHHKMKADSGWKFSIISNDKFNLMGLGVILESSNMNFRIFSSNIVPYKDKANVTVLYKN